MTTPTIERAEVPPRTDVMRMAPFALRADDDPAGDGRTLDGYGAVFNRETIIDSWEGRFRELIRPGAMKKSFRENPPRIQFDHGRHPLIGSIPIAQLSSITEDVDPVLAPEGGAHVVGRLHDNWLVQPVRDAIATRSIDGMSFRFSVVRDAWFDADGKQIRDEEQLRDLLRRTWFEDVPDEELILRELRELKVPEVGPVVWPAYDDTSVGVRSTVIDLGRLGDPEQRKALGYAVLMADVAERAPEEDEEPPPVTDDPAEPEVEADEHDDEPEAPTDEPQPTERERAPAGEHSAHLEMRYADWYLPAGDDL